MALLVHIKRGGRLFVNGAVLENASGRTTSVLLRNEATIMRGEDILPAADAETPATRLYAALQGSYLFADRREPLIALVMELAEAYERAAPSAAAILAEIRSAVDAGRLYAALKPCKALIEHEQETVGRLCGADPAPPQRAVPPTSPGPRSPKAGASTLTLAKAQRGADP